MLNLYICKVIEGHRSFSSEQEFHGMRCLTCQRFVTKQSYMQKFKPTPPTTTTPEKVAHMSRLCLSQARQI